MASTKFEDGASTIAKHTDNDSALCSIAISMKRIADALTQEGAGKPLGERLAAEHLAWLESQIAEPRAAEGAGTVAELTAVIAHDNGAAEAEKAIEAINRGDMIIRHDASEMFFHQLRYRVAKDPALCERIKVLYRDASGKLVPIGLRFEDELSWPSGFLQGSWEKEREIQLLRKPTAAAAVPAGGDAWQWVEHHARELAAKEAK